MKIKYLRKRLKKLIEIKMRQIKKVLAAEINDRTSLIFGMNLGPIKLFNYSEYLL